MTDRIKWGPNIGPGWKAVAEVAQAMDQGRPIQVRVGPDHQWVPQESSPRLNAKFEYRIGEEVTPREFIAGIFPGGKPVFLFDSMDEYNQWADGFQINPAFKRVREVIE